PHTVLQALNRQVAHYAYHIGQIVFLAKHFRSSDWKSLSIPRGKSEEYNRQPLSERKPGPSGPRAGSTYLLISYGSCLLARWRFCANKEVDHLDSKSILTVK